MSFPRVLQIIGIIVALEALYFGIVKDSMKLEMLFLFVGVMVFYAGRIFERRQQ